MDVKTNPSVFSPGCLFLLGHVAGEGLTLTNSGVSGPHG